MKKLIFDYYMQIDYTQEVSTCNYTIKCIPKNTTRQTIENMQIELFPKTVYAKGVDGLRNLQIYGQNHMPHDTFWFRITGEALVGMAAYEEEEDEDITMIFRHPYGMNVAGAKIRAYFKQVMEELGQVLDLNGESSKQPIFLAKEMMHFLHRNFQYQKNSTTIYTNAEEAFSQGCGVCQDYAHIFIALLHLAGLTVRYVTGLIVGEGASHAWVEVLQDGKWYGFDPTNDKVVLDEHIKIAVGRDAHDCMINRGIMHGGGNHTQTISVTVREEKETRNQI